MDTPICLVSRFDIRNIYLTGKTIWKKSDQISIVKYEDFQNKERQEIKDYVLLNHIEQFYYIKSF